MYILMKLMHLSLNRQNKFIYSTKYSNTNYKKELDTEVTVVIIVLIS